MSNTITIKTIPNGNDKYLKVNLEQDFDFIKILSLNISQEDVYRQFCSDYGVIVGRVVVNSGFGVPNAKVSVFIPIDDVDKQNPTIRGLYPYEIVTDKDSQGIRYNLLPKESETNNDCFTPVGTFPTKREILDNDTIMGIYCKYYKFTTTTNHAGDFMIFGVPIGTYTVHVDADISDIGPVSQRPYDLVRQGTPEKLFASGTKFLGGTNIDKLPQIKTANVGVNVQPFWGDLNNCQIGITRVDVDLNYTIEPSAIFIGSIFGDQEKNSINKNCRPRKKLGELCEQITGQGTIEMIRKSFDGGIESFDVEGGRVIDDDGTWAYQVPMNLDYVVTSEDGSLIPSNDPNIGVPTRASVRFRIGLDETGSEARLRTRAKYLVPNNPQSASQIDYYFGDKTKDSSLKDLYWNKIYSVSNFIPRYQKINIPTARTITGIKNVDGCAGDKTPFPYNRVNVEVNPIFGIVCILISIITTLVSLINTILIGGINAIISVINSILEYLSFLGINPIPLIPCITIPCPTENGNVLYAPGCNSNNTTFPTTGLADCISFSIAKTLDMYQFDFYNDWINGTLYSFLLKYKKRNKSNEKFCEYDCGDFQGDPNYTGVDGNENNTPDNDCNNQYLVDTLFPNGSNSQNEFVVSNNIIREGLVKKVEDDFYYAATNHAVNEKLFATDIICLGSVFECDWQGFPKLQQFLIPTSFNLPPDVEETNSAGQVLETGIVELGSSIGQLFSINCLGLHVNSTQALNFRHICEIFVDSDSAIEGPNNVIITAADGVIGSNDINENGKLFRNTFMYLNSSPNSISVYNPPPSLDSDFNTTNQPIYDFTSSQNNPSDYLSFRGYVPSYNGTYNFYSQPEHSFYMYFGLLPGKSSVEKLSQRYFGVCNPKIKQTMIIDVTVTPDTTDNFSGGISFTFIDGHMPYTYTVTGPNNYSVSGSTLLNVHLTGLEAGTYVITGVDLLGNTITQTVIVAGPAPLFCNASVTNNASSVSSFDGQITVNIGGGLSPYTFLVTDSLGNPCGSPNNEVITSLPLVVNNLASEMVDGYTVTVTDANGNTCQTTGLFISVGTGLSIASLANDTSCYNSNDGSIELSVFGGNLPYSITTTGAGVYNQNDTIINSLSVGNYTTTVVDAIGNSVSINTMVNSSNPQLIISSPAANILAKQCSINTYNIPFEITSGLAIGSIAYISYSIDNGPWVDSFMAYNGSLNNLAIPASSLNSNVRIKFSNSSTRNCYSNIITINKSQITLPTSSLNADISSDFIGGSYMHVISTNGGTGAVTNSPYSIVFNYNPSTQTSIGTITNSSPTITTTITDSVGCQIIITG